MALSGGTPDAAAETGTAQQAAQQTGAESCCCSLDLLIIFVATETYERIYPIYNGKCTYTHVFSIRCLLDVYYPDFM